MEVATRGLDIARLCNGKEQAPGRSKLFTIVYQRHGEDTSPPTFDCSGFVPVLLKIPLSPAKNYRNFRSYLGTFRLYMK